MKVKKVINCENNEKIRKPKREEKRKGMKNV